jgi:hypothetical protein
MKKIYKNHKRLAELCKELEAMQEQDDCEFDNDEDGFKDFLAQKIIDYEKMIEERASYSRELQFALNMSPLN